MRLDFVIASLMNTKLKEYFFELIIYLLHLSPVDCLLSLIIFSIDFALLLQEIITKSHYLMI